MPRDWPQSKVLRLVVGKQEEIINIVTVLCCFLFESTEEKLRELPGAGFRSLIWVSLSKSLSNIHYLSK